MAAIATPELGLLAAAPGDRPLPIASVAKVMTAVVVLSDHPLAAGQPGPEVTITAADAAEQQALAAAGQSTVAVVAGERLTEYQLLQGLLIPSGNNLADVLGVWDAGSVPAFVARLNTRARTLGLAATTFADASGFSPQTRASAADLARLALVAAADPVIAGIAAQDRATLPVAGQVYNVDRTLGQAGIDGIKTGNTEEAGGCFMFSATFSVAGRTVRVMGAVLGAPTLDDAFAAARALAVFTRDHLTYGQVLAAGRPVAEYRAPWGARAGVGAARPVYMESWPGLAATLTLATAVLSAPVGAGAPAGTVSVRLGAQRETVPALTLGPIPPPGAGWRLTRLR